MNFTKALSMLAMAVLTITVDSMAQLPALPAGPRSATQLLDSGFTSWQWLNPLPQGNTLYGVQTVSPGRTIGVGAAGTVVKTTNGGTTWDVQHYAAGVSSALRAIAFTSTNLGTAVGDRGIILRTTDGGGSWTRQASGTSGRLSSVVFPLDSVGIAVGDSGLILISTNSGATWNSRISGTTAALAGISFGTALAGVAVGENGTILRTTTGGTSWTLQTSGTFEDLHAVTFYNSATAIAVGDMATVLRTVDGGITWTSQVNLPPVIHIYGVSFRDASVGVAVGGFYYPGESTPVVFLTSNGGLSWNHFTLGSNGYLTSVALSADGSAIGVGTSGAIFNTTSPYLTWESQSSGATYDFHSICFGDSTHGTVVGDWGLIMQTTNGGTRWEERTSGTGTYFRDIAFTSATTGIAVAEEDWGCCGGMFSTTDGGDSWTGVADGYDEYLQAVTFPTSSVGYAVGSAILRSTNGGINWTSQTSPISPNFNGVSFLDADTGIIVGYSGTILRTTDRGDTWLSLTSGTSLRLRDVVLTSAKTGWIVGDGGLIFHTTNAGQTWVLQTSPTSRSLYSVAAVDAMIAIVVGSNGESYRTTNGGTTWIRWNTPTTNELYRVRTVRSGSGWVVYAVGEGGTILVSALSPLHGRTWTWTGAADSSWNTITNWSPAGLPLPGDSVIIPPAARSPIVDQVQQQVLIGSLDIRPGGRLTLTDALPRFVVLGDITIGGTLEVRWPATTSIVVGGNWKVLPDAGPASTLEKSGAVTVSGGFIPGYSTVCFTGAGLFSSAFYNLVIDSASSMGTSGNVTIQHQCRMVGDVTLRKADTLFVDRDLPEALLGAGKIESGTIRRKLHQGSTQQYRFGSESTYVKFSSAGTLPTSLTVSVFPESTIRINPLRWREVPSNIDTATNSIRAANVGQFSKWALGVPQPRFPGGPIDSIVSVSRFYQIRGDGGSAFAAVLSLRYDQIEVASGLLEDSLRLYRVDSSMEISPACVLSPESISFGETDIACQAVIPFCIKNTGGGNLTILSVVSDDVDFVCDAARAAIPPAESIVAYVRFNPATAGERTGRIFINHNGDDTPDTLHVSGIGIGAVPATRMEVVYGTGWHLVSLPLEPTCPVLEPRLFRYTTAYTRCDTLGKGCGYWKKFIDDSSLTFVGFPRTVDTVEVLQRWNIVGSLSASFPTSSITSIPENIVRSPYFGYGDGYYLADKIEPGQAYWVRADRGGRLVLGAASAGQSKYASLADEMKDANRLIIQDAQGGKRVLYFSTVAGAATEVELPPELPGDIFDARFGSGRLVELVNGQAHAIVLSAARYPLLLRWELVRHLPNVRLEIGGRIFDMNSNSSAEINDQNEEITLRTVSESVTPVHFALDQNYPNPFNPSTVIHYQLPVQSQVSLKVYNLLGQEVAVLVNGRKEAGRHEVVFDGSNRASGVYMYRLQAGDFISSKKLLMVK